MDTKLYLFLVAIGVVFFTALPNTDLREDAGSDPTYACMNVEEQVRVIPPDTGCYPDESAMRWAGSDEVPAALEAYR